LPDDQNVLFTIWSAAPEWDDAAIAVANLESGDHRVILERGTFGRYASSGHILFWRSGGLWAVPFDPDRIVTTGEEKLVVDGVRLDGKDGNAHFSISETGTLAYISGGLDYFEETLIADRSGSTLVPHERLAGTGLAQFSPDGARVALTMYKGGTFHIGVFDLKRDILDPLTTENDNVWSTWTPDGAQLTYLSTAKGPYSFYSMSANGSGNPEMVLEGEPDFCCEPLKWSPDGSDVLFSKPGAVDNDIWVASPSSDRPATVLVDDRGDQRLPDWSPSGRYFVYQSNQDGIEEIYIRPFPEADTTRERVSISGGRSPVWNRDGATIYYASDKGIMGVSFTEGADPGAFTLGRPTLVLEMTGVNVFDVSPDEEMFVVNRNPIETFATEINIVLNWFEELKQKVPLP
jgi:Tol biopolymer transport system component